MTLYDIYYSKSEMDSNIPIHSASKDKGALAMATNGRGHLCYDGNNWIKISQSKFRELLDKKLHR